MSIASRPRMSILVVDDEPTIAEIVARFLERAGDHARVAGDDRAQSPRLRSIVRMWSCWT